MKKWIKWALIIFGIIILLLVANYFRPRYSFETGQWCFRKGGYCVYKVPSGMLFTSPKDKFMDTFDKDPAKARAKAYDLTLNVQPPGAGKINLNTITLGQFPWTGEYFGNMENLMQWLFLLFINFRQEQARFITNQQKGLF